MPNRQSNPVGKPARKLRYKDSCDTCSLSKVKCTREHPICERCENRGFQCQYSPSQRRGKPRVQPRNNPATPSARTDSSLHHVEQGGTLGYDPTVESLSSYDPNSPRSSVMPGLDPHLGPLHAAAYTPPLDLQYEGEDMLFSPGLSSSNYFELGLGSQFGSLAIGDISPDNQDLEQDVARGLRQPSVEQDCMALALSTMGNLQLVPPTHCTIAHSFSNTATLTTEPTELRQEVLEAIDTSISAVEIILACPCSSLDTSTDHVTIILSLIIDKVICSCEMVLRGIPKPSYPRWLPSASSASCHSSSASSSYSTLITPIPSISITQEIDYQANGINDLQKRSQELLRQLVLRQLDRVQNMIAQLVGRQQLGQSGEGFSVSTGSRRAWGQIMTRLETLLQERVQHVRVEALHQA